MGRGWTSSAQWPRVCIRLPSASTLPLLLPSTPPLPPVLFSPPCPSLHSRRAAGAGAVRVPRGADGAARRLAAAAPPRAAAHAAAAVRVSEQPHPGVRRGGGHQGSLLPRRAAAAGPPSWPSAACWCGGAGLAWLQFSGGGLQCRGLAGGDTSGSACSSRRARGHLAALLLIGAEQLQLWCGHRLSNATLHKRWQRLWRRLQ